MNPTKVFLLAIAIALPGCGKPTSIGSPELEAASRQLVPQDSDIAAIYNRSCRSCHTVAATSAPLTGDAIAWAPRMEKGMDALVASVRNGLGAMPPGGLCNSCSDEDYAALITYMSTAQ